MIPSTAATVVSADPATAAAAPSAVAVLLAELYQKLGRAPRAYEIGSTHSHGVLEMLAGKLPVTVLSEAAADADLVLIHAELEFEALVQTLYALRDALRLDTVLCGFGIHDSRWPGTSVAVPQFIGDYRTYRGLWIANRAGVQQLKLWPEYASVAHLVQQVQAEHDKRARAPQPARAAARPATLSAEEVRWALRVLLDREPQSPQETEDQRRRLPDMAALRRELAASSEFKEKNPGLFWLSCSGDEPRMALELEASAAERSALLAHVQSTWEHLGATEPHWSVLTAEQFKRARIAETEEAFYRTGEANVQTLWRTLARNGIEPARLHSCLEYGCGLGRVTRWLAARFATVYGVDISRAHLQGAAHHLAGRGIGNVEFRHVAAVAELAALPRVDLVYSVIVLQHNPPPVIEAIVQALLAALNPGGVAYFQVPTYQRGYRFVCREYLASRGGERHMEMHVLPQARVFELAAAAKARVLEVLEDKWTGIVDGGRSNTFVIHKD
jgi:SAM-dependent methyltransferase